MVKIAQTFAFGRKNANQGSLPEVKGQVTGYRSHATDHRSGHRSHTKIIGHWTKLFWTDVLPYKNKKSQKTFMIFLFFKQYLIPHVE